MRSTQQPRHRPNDAGKERKKKRRQLGDAAPGLKRCTLRVIADETVARFILDPHLAAFASAHPSLSIALERQIKRGGPGRARADLILRYGASTLAGSGGDVLHAQRLLTCAAPHYLRVRGLPHHPHDLRGTFDALVISDDPGAPSPWRFENMGQKLSVKPDIRAVTPSPSTALALAKAGVGIAQIPECWVLDEIRTGKLIRLLPEWEPTVHLQAHLPCGDAGPDPRDFIRFIRMLFQTTSAGGRPEPVAAQAIFPQCRTPHGDGVGFGG